MARTKRTGIVVAKYPTTTRNYYEIFAIKQAKGKKEHTITSLSGRKYTGYFGFGWRLISRNGNLIGAGHGLNTKSIAIKSMKAASRGGVLA